MFSYAAYNLGVQSPLPLPEFLPGAVADNLVIHVPGNDGVLPEDIGTKWVLKITAEAAVLPFMNVGVFQVRNGNEITILPVQPADERLIRLCLVGTVMAVVLYQRGFLVLHASAIDIGGRAITFLGDSGSGKSSLAAALHARGHRFMNDDVTPIRMRPDSMMVVPGYPQLKVNPEVAAFLGYDHTMLRLLHEDEAKLGYSRMRDSFAQTPAPLHRIYILGTETEPRIEPLNGSAAAIELVRHTYPTRLGQPGDATQFLHIADLVRAVPVYRLMRSSRLASLSQLAQMIEQQVEFIV